MPFDDTCLIMRQMRRSFDPDNPVIYTDNSNPRVVDLKPRVRVIIEKEWDAEIRFIGHCVIDSVDSSPKPNPLRPWRMEFAVKLKDFQPFVPPRMKNDQIRQMLNSIPFYYWGDSIRLIPKEVFNAIILFCSKYDQGFDAEFEVPLRYDSLDRILERDESDTLEFKATFCTPVENDKKIAELERLLSVQTDPKLIQEYNKEIEKRKKEIPGVIQFSVVKTIAAFLNTNGGTLIVGALEKIDRKKDIIGIEVDYPNIGNVQNYDGWRRHLLQVLAKFGISQAMIANNIHPRSDPKDGKTLARIDISPAEKETWLTVRKDGKEEKHFYVRSSGKTESLWGPDAIEYIKHRFK